MQRVVELHCDSRLGRWYNIVITLYKPSVIVFLKMIYNLPEHMITRKYIMHGRVYSMKTKAKP